MYTDQQGFTLTGASRNSLESYNAALQAFHLYRGDPLALLDATIAEAPDFAMAHITRAILLATTSEPAALDDAAKIATHCTTLRMNPREHSLLQAVVKLTAADWQEASHALDKHNAEYPLDLPALQTGHLTDFYCARSHNLCERIARALPHWDSGIPGYSFVLGMHAFGLEEAGDYAQAEDAGRKAVSLEPYDCWAHHAVAHVMEMQGRPEDGIGWMLAREPYWSEDSNFFKVHNWWHRAVFHLDLGQVEEAIALYDSTVRATCSSAALDLVDASAPLWRLHLAGADVGKRWDELARAWLPHADGITYPFNDWHAAMALPGAGMTSELNELVERLRSSPGNTVTGDWIARIGLPLIQGFTAFWQEDYQEAIKQLQGVRGFGNAFGGSHAQRDIIELTLMQAMAKVGYTSDLQALAKTRLDSRPYSHMTRNFLRLSAA